MNFTAEQNLVINTTEPRVLVNASAAAGKTATLTARLQHLIDIGETDIVAITFTNNAANELQSRLKNPKGIFVGTVHSYCNYLLVTHGIDTRNLLDKEDFDGLFDLIKKNPQCRRHVNHLLVDEAQDSTQPQFDFFFNYIRPTNYMMLFDVRQCVYQFAHANPDFLIELMDNSDVTIYELTKNYRNGEAILNFARTIIHPLGPDYYDHSFPCAPWSGYVYEKAYTKEEFLDTVIQKAGPRFYGEWFILCRTNIEVNQFIELCEERNIPCTTFKQSELSTSEIQNKLNEQCVKILTMHSSKGLESDRVAVWNPKPKRSEEERRLCYVAATRARKQLWWIRAKSSKKKKQKVKTFDWE